MLLRYIELNLEGIVKDKFKLNKLNNLATLGWRMHMCDYRISREDRLTRAGAEVHIQACRALGWSGASKVIVEWNGYMSRI